MPKTWDKRYIDLKVEEMTKQTNGIILPGNIDRTGKGIALPKLKLEPYTVIDHLGAFGVEGYGIQPNPNTYGLHDDGTNVFTVRQDDLPFTDVGYAFAVEEETTNLIQNPSFENTIGSEWSVIQDVSLSRVSTSSKFGSYSAQVVATKDNSWGGIYQKYSVALGNKYTISVWVRALDTNSVGKNARVAFVGYDSSNAPTTEIYYTFLTLPSDWTLYTLSVTVADRNTTQGVFRFQLNDTVTGCGAFVDGFQVEAKPFATSFVDGTRAHGIVKLTNPPLPLDNFVVNLWFKPTRYPTQTGHAWRLFNVSYNAGANRGIGLSAQPIDFGSTPANVLYLFLVDGTVTRYNLGFDLSAEIGKWHMLTLISNGSIVDVYIDGVKRVSATNDVQRSAIEFIVFGRYFANISDSAQENGSLMSNLLFASYDPNIWTDEFIQAIYNNQVLAKALKQVEKSPTPPQGLKTKYNITHMGELLLQDPDVWQMWFSKANFDKKIVTLGWKWGE